MTDFTEFINELREKVRNSAYDTLLVGEETYEMILYNDTFYRTNYGRFVGTIVGINVFYYPIENPVLLRAEDAFPVARDYQKD